MIYLPIASLPEDTTARLQLLNEYFTGQFVTTTLTNNTWSINLCFPDLAEYYVDPLLLEGLAWWDSNLKISEIPISVKRKKNCQISLNDSWTLFSWSQWLSSTYTEQISLPSEIVILHIDDHDDLMCPRVWKEELGWTDSITGKSFNLIEPVSVSNAIKSGAIGIGSFIVPLIHLIPRVRIHHLCATEYSLTRQGHYFLPQTLVPDQLLNPTKQRIATELQNFRGLLKDIGNTSIYKVTNNLDEWLKDIPSDAPILLHIDMDYFNNRFNGDSDWEIDVNRHDPSCEEVIASINAVFHALFQNRIIDRISDVSIALSPGFFPAELWESAISQIQCHLNNSGIKNSSNK